MCKDCVPNILRNTFAVFPEFQSKMNWSSLTVNLPDLTWVLPIQKIRKLWARVKPVTAYQSIVVNTCRQPIWDMISHFFPDQDASCSTLNELKLILETPRGPFRDVFSSFIWELLLSKLLNLLSRTIKAVVKMSVQQEHPTNLATGYTDTIIPFFT